MQAPVSFHMCILCAKINSLKQKLIVAKITGYTVYTHNQIFCSSHVLLNSLLAITTVVLAVIPGPLQYDGVTLTVYSPLMVSSASVILIAMFVSLVK